MDSTHEFTIRKATPEDADAIVALSVAAFEGETVDFFLQGRFGPRSAPLRGKTWEERHAETIRKHVSQSLEQVFVAEVEGRLAGYMTYRLDPEASTGTVSYNAVHPDYQGRGIATGLIARVLNTFRQQGLRYARVTTLETDIRARGLYEKAGFTELVKLIDYVQELRAKESQ